MQHRINDINYPGKDGADLFNRNCFDYLQKLAKNINITTSSFMSQFTYLSELKNIFYDKQTGAEIIFDPSIRYNDLYANLLLSLQKDIPTIAKILYNDNEHENKGASALIFGAKVFDDYNPNVLNAKEIFNVDMFIHCIYANENGDLNRSAEFAKKALGNLNPLSEKAKSLILKQSIGIDQDDAYLALAKKHASHTLSIFQEISPHGEESAAVRGFKMFSPNFQPQLATSIPSKRTYDFHAFTLPNYGAIWSEYRFGTQGEIVDSKPRVNPLFVAWLETQERLGKAHIYFNNLGLDGESYERDRERSLTLQLHALEKKHPHLIVITLPSDKGIMDHDMLHGNKSLSLQQAYEKIFDIVTKGSSITDTNTIIKDFYISDEVKKRLYGSIKSKYDEYREKEIINFLFEQSLNKLGLNKPVLSSAETQALFFDFIKFQLTDFIITKIHPDSINFSCKDAIDRGGVSSLYFNLIKSIEIGRPMSEFEFFTALHAAPTMVKGRGMNDHLERVWNAISTYMDGQAQNASPALIPDWLIRMKKDHIIASTLNTFNYTIKTDINLSHADYIKFTSDYQSKPDGYNLTAVKGKIALEFIKNLSTIISNPINMTTQAIVKEIFALIDEALKKSEYARSNIGGTTVPMGKLDAQLIEIKKQLINTFMPKSSEESSIITQQPIFQKHIQERSTTHMIENSLHKGNSEDIQIALKSRAKAPNPAPLNEAPILPPRKSITQDTSLQTNTLKEKDPGDNQTPFKSPYH